MNIRRLLACEALSTETTKGETTSLSAGLTLTRHDIASGNALGAGAYLTLRLPARKGWDCDVSKGVARALTQLLKGGAPHHAKALVVGLGNRNLLCDRLGPDTVERLTPTDRLVAICPMVKEQTGLDTASVVRAVAAVAQADLVVAVDSLVCRDPNLLLRTAELSDAGLTPGGGVGLPQMCLNRQTLGVPFCYLGVPTLSYVNPYVDTLCVTVQDMPKQEVLVAQSLADAITSALN